MPCRQTYEINNREQGKAAQRDQSYKSCLIALLIFFFLCLIFILACLPWKTRSQIEYRYVEREPQHHHGEHAKEPTTITAVPSTTLTTAKTTSTMTISTESTPEDEFDVITEDHSRKNVKGSRTFERYSENRTTEDETVTSSAITPKGIAEDYTTITEKISRYTEVEEKNYSTAERNIGLATSQRDTVTDNVIDNDTNPTSPSGPIVSTATLKYTVTKYNVTIVEIVDPVTTSELVKETETEKYPPDQYYSTEKSEFDAAADNNTTLSTASASDLEENATEDSTSVYERSEIDIVTDNITSSTPSLSTDLRESTSAKYSSDNYYHSEKLVSDATTINITTSTSSTRSDPEEDKDINNSTNRYLNNEGSTAMGYNATLIDNVTTESSFVTKNRIPLLTEKLSTTTEIINKAENTTDIIIVRMNSEQSEATEKYNENVSAVETEKYNVSSTDNYANATTFLAYKSTAMVTTVAPTSRNETTMLPIAMTTLLDEDANVCETGHCKQIASKILSYMNHSVDPCDDFYEYACGGFEADPQLIDGDMVRRSRNYQRIARQMLKEKRENVHSTFATYYDSCVQYERNMNFSERAKMANDALRQVGEFYIAATWSDNNTGFTDLFARLMLHHSALLFDIVPELDEYRLNSFTLKIGPSTYESPFRTEKYVEDPCSEDEIVMKERYVDLVLLYDNYRRCKNDTREFMRSIREALTELGVFKGLNDSRLERNVEFEHIEKTVDVINSVVMQGYFSHFPSRSEIREAYLMNNYSKISLEELQSSSAFVNWRRLIRSLTGVNVNDTEGLQVYFHTALVKGLRRLEEFGKEDPMSLNNAIMGLYAHKFYRELVLSRRDNVKDQCLRVASYLLRLEASSLYISSFSDQEIEQMNRMTESMFGKLKRTLKLKTEEAQWAREEGQQGLLKKIESLKLALPAVSYFKKRDSLYKEYNVPQIILYDNYFNNSMTLLRRYRTLMYAELRRPVGDPAQIWTYYATPFQSKARAIYGLNLVVIPYGAVDWSLINDEISFDYLLLANLGNLIAHQIAHHFDANGIHYWDQTRNTQDSLMYENEFTNANFDDYINCQKESLYQGLINMTLSFTDQVVSFTIPQLTLNERLSEIMGLRLAYDTLALTRSDAEERLPWIKLRIDQLFYLAYAQMYCTKSPLTSSYVSLYESEDLPSRIHVFVSASNNKLLAEAWNCPVGSQIAPNDICSVFPYIEFKETGLIPE